MLRSFAYFMAACTAGKTRPGSDLGPAREQMMQDFLDEMLLCTTKISEVKWSEIESLK